RRLGEVGGGRSPAGTLQLLQRHPPCSLLLAPCSLIRLLDCFFNEPASFPCGRLVKGCPRPAQCVFHLLARFEQVGTGLVARLAFETLSASFHLPLARRQLRGARVDLLRVPAQTLITRGELLLLRVELPSPGLDSGEQRVQLPLGFRHGPLG